MEHCYVAYVMMTLGVVDYPKCTKYKTTYDVIRNRECEDGTTWLKPPYVKAFRKGVFKEEDSDGKKKVVNMINRILKWKTRSV